MSFTVKTQSFEGPLDLLLDLIEKHKLFINDISLAKVTDEYIAHVKQLGDLPMAESAHFILIASTLLLIKSRSLLPDLNLTEEEKVDIRDLEIRLEIFQRIKSASRHVDEMFGRSAMYGPSSASPIRPIFAPDRCTNPLTLLQNIRDLIKRLPRNEVMPKALVRKVISLEEMIGSLTTRISSQLRMSFKDFTGKHRGDRVHVIVSFLAMLELVKNGILHVSQDSIYGDIQMETKEVSVPRY